MAMTSMNVSLPEALKRFVEQQTEFGDYSTPSEYVRELIREDRQRHGRAQPGLEAQLLEAARSPLAKVTSQDLAAPDWLDRIGRKFERSSQKSTAKKARRVAAR